MGRSKSREAVHMALSVDAIAGHPELHAAMRLQAQSSCCRPTTAIHRLASVFGTQHRWLMAQAALAVGFRCRCPEQRM